MSPFLKKQNTEYVLNIIMYSLRLLAIITELPTNISSLFWPHGGDINELNMICHAVNVDKKNISSLIYFFFFLSEKEKKYVAFCFQCK